MVAEETILETALTDPFLFYFLLDLVNIAAADTFVVRVYQKVDGTNYRLKDQQSFSGAQTILVYEVDSIYGDTGCDIKVTIQRTAGADKAFPYRFNYQKEV